MDGTLPTRPAAFWKHPGLGSINKVLKNDAENGCIIDPQGPVPPEARPTPAAVEDIKDN